MGIFLLAAIVFILFIVFIADLLRDSKEHRRNFESTMFRQYGEEFADDDDFELDSELEEYEYEDFEDFEEIEELNNSRADDFPFSNEIREYDVEMGDITHYSPRHRDIEEPDDQS